MRSGLSVSRDLVASVCDVVVPGQEHPMSLDQAWAVESIATSGRLLDVLVGPAGSGKTTALAALRRAWEAAHGPASVVGLAPSATAAEVLAAELGIATENTAKWLTEVRRRPGREQRLAQLRHELEALPTRRSRVTQLAGQIAELEAQIERWRLGGGQLVIVDEASLAGTRALDELLTVARRAGAKVLLVGDWAQLSAVEAGGAFAMVVADRDDAPDLVDVHRFSAPWEARASLALRTGDESAIEAYSSHGRIAEGGRDEMLDALYEAWRADVAAGKASLMIAGDLDSVAALNERARAARVATGEVSAEGVVIADGAIAGVGDRVVTRENNRRLSAGGRWVRNGDEWVITATSQNGSMTVRRRETGGVLVLAVDYVRDHVELAYAVTSFRVQGATVDTAHALVGATTTREALYVAATRARESNRLYVDVTDDPDPDTSHGDPERARSTEVLQRVLRSSAAEVAATVAISRELEAASSIATLAAEYQTIAQVAQAERWDTLLKDSGLAPVVLDEVRSSPAYGALTSALRDAEARGLAVETTVPLLVHGRSLEGAGDIAAVLHSRVDRWIEGSGSRRRPPSGALIAGIIPAARGITDPDLSRALEERATAMEARARNLAEEAIDGAQPWLRALGPVPAELSRRAPWLAEVATVAAYRDRWGIETQDLLGALPIDNLERLGRARQARRAIERARALVAIPVHPRAGVEVAKEVGVGRKGAEV